MDIAKAAFIFFTSLIAGFMGGQVGGGGLLNLPALLLIGLDPLVALGTNKFASFFYVFISARSFYKHHKIPLKQLLLFGTISLVGSLLGVLKELTVFVLLVVSAIIFFKQNLGLDEKELEFSKKHFALLIFFIFVVSVYGGMFSIAMSTLFATVFALNKQSFLKSMSFSLALTTIVIFSSVIPFILQHSVNYHFALVQAIGGSIGSVFGSRLAIKKGNVWIKNFSLIIVVVLLVKLFFEIYG